MLDGWIMSTRNQRGGCTHNRKLFGLPDRMLWVTGLIRYERARELEYWAMDAISEIFPKIPCEQERQLSTCNREELQLRQTHWILLPTSSAVLGRP